MVTIKQLSGAKFSIETRHHSIICDQPVENGGTDEGMTPPELMLASLGSCAAFYAVQYLKTRGLADGGVEVTVTAEKLRGPARLSNFELNVTCPVALNTEQEEAMMRSVHACLIHNTLMNPPQISLRLQAPEFAAAR